MNTTADADNTALSDLGKLLSSMEPRLNPGIFAYVSTPDWKTLQEVEIYAMVREPEGISAVVKESDAKALGLPIMFRTAWITLTVQSDLKAVGLTVAFSEALAGAGISCNVVAGAWHDHIFVPAARGEEAVAVLRHLQKTSSSFSRIY